MLKIQNTPDIFRAPVCKSSLIKGPNGKVPFTKTAIAYKPTEPKTGLEWSLAGGNAPPAADEPEEIYTTAGLVWFCI